MSVAHLDVSAFVDRRTKALASVFLTSPPGVRDRVDQRLVRVFDVESDLGLDLLAKVSSTERDRVLLFGVVLKGTTDAPPSEEEALVGIIQNHLQIGQFAEYPFPVIELIFSMEGDRGYFAWRNEPVLASGGDMHLKLQKNIQCRPAAGRKSLVEFIDRVESWYAFFYQSQGLAD